MPPPAPTSASVEHARNAWNRALMLGEINGYRNAQASVIAPTGTIGLIMDCDTTGIEPDFALVKFKKLAGGGYFKIINGGVPEALRALGYGESEIKEIIDYAVGRGTLKGSPAIGPDSLRSRGFTDEKIAVAEAGLATAFDIKFVFNKWTLGEAFLKSLGFTEAELADPAFDLLAALGYTQEGHRGGEPLVLRRDDAGRRARPEARAPAGLRLRQSLRADGKTLPLGREPHPHDGGGAAVHLGRHLEDHQHAERRHRRGLQERLPACRGSWR